MTTITLQPDDRFLITGRRVCGKKFRIVTSNAMHAFGINLFDGNIWLVRNGKRKLLQRVQSSFYTIVNHLRMDRQHHQHAMDRLT